MFDSLPRNLIKLEVVDIPVANNALEAIAAHFPHLQHFILRPNFPPSMEHFIMGPDHARGMASAGLTSIFSSCIYLKLSILHIELSDDVTDFGISALAEGCCLYSRI